MTNEIEQDSLLFKFDGASVDDHSVSISTLVDSLNGLDKLARKTAENCYSKKVKVDVKVKALKPGSFIVDILLDYIEPVRLAVENAITFNEVFVSVFELGKFLLGKGILKSEPLQNDMYKTTITNCKGQQQVFNNCTVSIYSNNNTAAALDKITSPLSKTGIDNISIACGSQISTIDKSQRDYFVNDKESVLSDNESIVILEVVSPVLNGASKGWKFWDGDHEFTADIDDLTFLERVKNKEIIFQNGMQLEVSLRVVQTKHQRLYTERTITEVKRTLL